MIKEECVKYLLNRIQVSTYLRENITIAESERLTKWISELGLDEVLTLVSEEGETKEKILARLKRYAVAAPGASKEAGKAIGKGVATGAKAVGGAAKVAGKGVATGAKAVGGATKVAAKNVSHFVKDVGGAAKTAGKNVGSFAQAHPYKTAAIGASAIGAALAGRAVYKKYFSQCAKACKGSADKADCMAKCKAAAKTKIAQVPASA